MLKSLFAIRGTLNAGTSALLSFLGFIIVLTLWFGLAEVLSKKIVKQIDKPLSELPIKDKTYYNQDSLLVANYGKLEKLDDNALADYGLSKEKVYPLLPSPLNVLKSFSELFTQDNLLGNSWYSIKLNLLGYVIAIIIAIPIGFILGLIPLFRALFSKLIDSVRFIPLTAVTGIFIMWFGLGSQMKVFFLAFGILVYLIPVVVQRIHEVEDVYLKTVFTLGATSWQTIWTVYLPYVMSKLIDDIRVLTAISWTYITIAEMLNKGGGIGELIWMAKRQSRIDKAFAILIIIVLIGIIQDRIFFYLDRVLFKFKHVNENHK
jgi:NitT/TauT family transport system permease protein